MPSTLDRLSHIAYSQYKIGNLKVENDALKYRPQKDSDGFSIVLPDEVREPLESMKAYERIAIMEKLEKAWRSAGGKASPLGLPAQNEIDLYETPSGFVSHFRGGNVEINKHADKFSVPKHYRSTIELVAMQCAVRSEKEDEIYGSVAVITDQGSQEFQIPLITIGKRRRIQQFHKSFDIGPPSRVMLHSLLVEKDSGKSDEIRKKIAKFYDDVGKKVKEYSDVVIGKELSEVGVDTIRDILTIATFGIATLFDMGDDPFDPAWKALQWTDLVNTNPTVHTYGHHSDPQTGKYLYNMRAFEAGGNGQYELFFSQRLEEINVLFELSQNQGPN